MVHIVNEEYFRFKAHTDIFHDCLGITMLLISRDPGFKKKTGSSSKCTFVCLVDPKRFFLFFPSHTASTAFAIKPYGDQVFSSAYHNKAGWCMQHLEKVSLGLLLCCYCWATGGTGRGRPLWERQISLHQRLACIFPAISLLYVGSLTLSGHAALRKCPLGCCGWAALDSEGAPELRALTPSPSEMWIRVAFEGLWLNLLIGKAVGWQGKCLEMIGTGPTLLESPPIHGPVLKQ